MSAESVGAKSLFCDAKTEGGGLCPRPSDHTIWAISETERDVVKVIGRCELHRGARFDTVVNDD
jgi:hypothetical protein